MKHLLKKSVSLLFIMAIIFSVSVTAYAGGWLEHICQIELNTQYTDSITDSDFYEPIYYYGNGGGFEDAYWMKPYMFTVNKKSQLDIRIESSCEDYTTPTIYLYSVNNIDILTQFYGNSSYSSAKGVYSCNYTTTLPTGEYYIVLKYKDSYTDYYGTYSFKISATPFTNIPNSSGIVLNKTYTESCDPTDKYIPGEYYSWSYYEDAIKFTLTDKKIIDFFFESECNEYLHSTFYITGDNEYYHSFDLYPNYSSSKEKYTDSEILSLEAGTYYLYAKYYVSNDYFGGYNFTLKDITPASVKLGKISNTSSGIKITWSAVSGADNYNVYRKEGSAKSWTEIATAKGSATSYTDTTAKAGKTYAYTVAAKNTNGEGSYNKTGLKILRITQPTVKVANKNGYVNVSWGKVTGAKGYYVYRKAGSATNWTRIATIKDGATVAYKDKSVNSGTNYKYTVKAYNGSYVSSYCSGVATKYLAQPTVKVANKNGYVSVTWGKISGANGYYVYRKAGSATSWTKVATISSGSTVTYNDKNVKNGTAYKYTVKAFNGSYVSAYCSGIATKYLTAGKVASATSAKAGITVKWGKNASASGYYVYRKVGSGSWSKIATVKTNTTVSYLDKSANKGTTYTYCVRPYNGSYSGTYANTVKCNDKY